MIIILVFLLLLVANEFGPLIFFVSTLWSIVFYWTGSNLAKRKNRYADPWGFFAAVFPPFLLVLLTLDKKQPHQDTIDSLPCLPAAADEWTPLHAAASQGHGVVVRELVAAGANVEARRKDRATALHDAAANGRGAVVKVLLESGADTEARTDNSFTTVLHWAAFYGHGDVVKVLLAAEADTEARDDKDGRMPRDVAKHGGIIRLLDQA